MRLNSTHPQISAETSKTSPESKTYPQSPNLSRAGPRGCGVSVAEGTGLGCPKLMGTAAGTAQGGEGMQVLPGDTLPWGAGGIDGRLSALAKAVAGPQGHVGCRA